MIHERFARNGEGLGQVQFEGRSVVMGPLQVCGLARTQTNTPMLHWTLVFLVIAIIAGVLGFGGLAGTAIGFAKILFVIFLILWIIAFVMRGAKG